MSKCSLLAVLGCCLTSPAGAQPFATPPETNEPLSEDREPPPTEDDDDVAFDSPSTVRVSVGPAVRVSQDAADGGLAAALDFGSGPAGARVSGTWVNVGSDRGLAEYRAELVIDFGAEKRLRPILGAGAGIARLDRAAANGTLETATYGIGVLRGTLEYVLPVSGADARAGVDAIGSVPAIHEKGADDPGAWLSLIARVGVGF
jgi:hypothetical protein